MARAPRRPSRGRLVLAATLAVLLTVLGLVLQRADDEPPVRPSGAALRLVPDDALVTVQVVADQTRPQVDDALRRLDDVPGGTALLARAREALVPAGCPSVTVRTRDVTVALLRVRPGGPTAPLVLLGRRGTRTDAGPVRRCRGRTSQRLGRFVAIGQPALVRRARRLLGSPGSRGSLAVLPLRRRLAGGLPDDRLLTAWLTPDGVRDVLATRGPAPAALAAVLDRPDLGGVALGAKPSGDGVRVVARLATAMGPDEDFPADAPVLAPAGAIGTMLTTDPVATASRAVDVSAAWRGVPSGHLVALVSGIVSRIDERTGGLVRRDVLEAQRPPSEVVLTMGSQAATPAGAAAAGTAVGPASVGPGAPVVTVVVPVVDGRRAARVLARLRPRLSRALGVPRFAVRRVAGRRSWTLRLPGGGSAGYLVDRDRVVVYTSRDAAEAVLGPGPRLPDRARWDRGGGEPANRTMSIGFLDFSQFVRVAAPPAAGARPVDRALLDGLRRVRSARIRSRTEGREAILDVDLRIP